MELRDPLIINGKQKFTVEEYLKLTKTSEIKFEYYRGEIFVMPDVGPQHNILFWNVYIGLAIRLQSEICRAYGCSLRINIPQNTLYTYPAILIIGGHLVEEESNDDFVSTTTVLIEVLSSPMKELDKAEKFRLYPGLKEHILINSELSS